jgi:hypothetical protein
MQWTKLHLATSARQIVMNQDGSKQLEPIRYVNLSGAAFKGDPYGKPTFLVIVTDCFAYVFL